MFPVLEMYAWLPSAAARDEASPLTATARVAIPAFSEPRDFTYILHRFRTYREAIAPTWGRIIEREALTIVS